MHLSVTFELFSLMRGFIPLCIMLYNPRPCSLGDIFVCLFVFGPYRSCVDYWLCCVPERRRRVSGEALIWNGISWLARRGRVQIRLEAILNAWLTRRLYGSQLKIALHLQIPCCEPAVSVIRGKCVTIRGAARVARCRRVVRLFCGDLGGRR